MTSNSPRDQLLKRYLHVVKDIVLFCYEIGRVVMIAMSISAPLQIGFPMFVNVAGFFSSAKGNTNLQATVTKAKYIPNDFLCHPSYAAQQHAQLAA